MSAAAMARRELDAGRPDKARVLLATALKRSPAEADLNNLMAVALIRMGQPQVALHYARAAATAAPAHMGVQINLGHCLSMCERFDEALGVIERVCEAHPSDLAAALALAESLVSARRYARAASYGRVNLDRFGSDVRFAIPYASALLHTGRAPEAVGVLQAAVAAHPQHPIALYRLAAAMLYAPGHAPGSILVAHRACAAQIERHCPAPEPFPPRAAGDKVRIGLLSPDLRTHSVASFVEAWIGRMDRSRFEVLAFSDARAEDDTSRRLQSGVDQWHSVVKFDNAALVGRLRTERLDVLIDLAGYTHANRLPLLHTRPARRIVTCIGYPATLGLAGVDARIVDAITDPPGAEAWHTESLVRLPRTFLCWQPPHDAPGPDRQRHEGDSPAGVDGAIVFGSFNAVQKICDPLLRAWARVLTGVPGSRLLLKASGLDEEALRDDLRARFHAHGGDPTHLDFMAFTKTPREHLNAYARVDVALDTFPYCGTTTTCEALFMGVPVVSLAGTMHHERVGLSLLTSIGHADLCAASIDDYIARAVAIAGDAPRRAALRASLRPVLLASPLCDGASYACALGDALDALVNTPRTETPT